ncbi:MAG: exodeoxyribonuclease VII small subunit [Thermoanaerobaculia bacterium]
MSESNETPSFGEAMEELEGILRKVEGEEIDIDELAEELQRAATLLELCRKKIRRAEVEVSQIVQGLEEPGSTEAEEPEPDEAPERPEQDAMF